MRTIKLRSDQMDAISMLLTVADNDAQLGKPGLVLGQVKSDGMAQFEYFDHERAVAILAAKDGRIKPTPKVAREIVRLYGKDNAKPKRS